MTKWFARPVVHVADVEKSVRFYVEKMGFEMPWKYEETGAVVVAQVERQDCALILSNQWPEKVGKALTFISLDGLDEVRAELEGRGVEVKEGSWGYRILIVTDPDGNQMYFNYPND